MKPAVALLLVTLPAAAQFRVDGELKLWHRVTVTFDGPSSGEEATPNPFRDFRLNVTFAHAASGKRYTAVQWYNPRAGGELQSGSAPTVSGPGHQFFGQPPAEADRDWVVLIKRR
jgi:hypothetical protein